ncbi:MAG: glycosyltransferase family 4 protein [Magnetococcales bacterium]|nr:glycosyltransferase family 4 protein [Magnetococcales bacterium]HIJ82731.1 glycosyltransferase family 4 protein [Magnetococcales bacterium]
MNILTFTTLYPSDSRPNHGLFVEHRIRRVAESEQVQLRVLAPVAWFPSSHPRFGNYAALARTPRHDQRFGLTIDHPRFPLIPKIGMNLTPWTMAAAMVLPMRKIIDEGFDFQLIDAHFLYPDGVAAALLGQWFNKPVVLTGRGTDITLIPQYRWPRHMITWACQRSAAVITVCQALKQALIPLGIPDEHIQVLPNGVDLDLFRPWDRETARRELGMTGMTLLSVGHLVQRKGHDIPIRALTALPEVRLVIAGGGGTFEDDNELALKQLAHDLGVADRVHFAGAVPQTQLPRYYSAADILVLASAREGWANVLLEAMACGLPVIASPVWGTPEVVTAPEAGVLMNERSVDGLLDAYARLTVAMPQRSMTRNYAEKFSWDKTTQGQMDLFQKILHKRPSA